MQTMNSAENCWS